MCCFTGPVVSVRNTCIFARQTPHGRQYVVYAMSIETKHDLAMVLPLPVAPGEGDDRLKFINLEGYGEFFDEMEGGFIDSSANPFGAAASAKSVAPVLAVQNVGAYEASFVPTVADFSRLDRRFRLPKGAVEKLPGYAGFGFAVFKLRKADGPVHPMAFSFLSAVPDRLFFPTLHIHDGEVHPKAEFDHTLYCQGTGLNHREWKESPGVASQFFKADRAKGTVMPHEHVYRMELKGELANTDWLVKARAVA